MMSTDLKLYEKSIFLYVTTDKKYALVCGCLENGKLIRLSMTVADAMRLLALLRRMQEDLNLPLPELPVERDTMQ